jgi:hypothetical protein
MPDQKRTSINKLRKDCGGRVPSPTNPDGVGRNLRRNVATRQCTVCLVVLPENSTFHSRTYCKVESRASHRFTCTNGKQNWSIPLHSMYEYE